MKPLFDKDSYCAMVERAKHYIGQHYADSELSVESVCTHLHLSPAYFSTLFKREEGMSFIAYVTKVRMERAAQLLLAGSLAKISPLEITINNWYCMLLAVAGILAIILGLPRIKARSTEA